MLPIIRPGGVVDMSRRFRQALPVMLVFAGGLSNCDEEAEGEGAGMRGRSCSMILVWSDVSSSVISSPYLRDILGINVSLKFQV